MTVPKIIEKIRKTPGIYLLTQPGVATLAAPVFVDELGAVWSMELDERLPEDGWHLDVEARGPLNFATEKLKCSSDDNTLPLFPPL